MRKAEQNPESGLGRYVGVVRRWRWTVISITVLVTVGALAADMLRTTIYAADAEVVIARQNLANQLTRTSDLASSSDFDQVLRTEAEVARSSALAALVVARASGGPATAQDLLDASKVTVKPGADIIVFRVEDSDKAAAAAVTREYALQYTRFRTRLDTAAVRRARQIVSARLASLRVEGDRDSRLYATLAAKEEELKTLEALQTSNATVIGTPTSSTVDTVHPTPLRTGVLGFVLGLLLGIIAAFVREALDTRLRSAQEIAELVHLPLLGELSRPLSPRAESELVMMVDPRGPEAEGYRILCTSLEFANLGTKARSILFTSAHAGEGKSTTVSNLAIALARGGHRVVLIDLDLRRPSVARFFGLEGAAGLTNILLGRTEMEDVVHAIGLDSTYDREQAEGAEHLAAGSLKVVPAGPLPPDPGDLVRNSALAEVINAVCELGDVVLIDTPPMLAVGDAMALAYDVDALVLVARLGEAARPSLQDANRLMRQAPAKPLGVVVTGTAAEVSNYYGYSAPEEAPDALSIRQEIGSST